jgi:hypothetical protein
MPLMVVYTKMVPRNIEATCFALFTSASNLGHVLSGLIGTAVNVMYIGVSKDNLDDYYILNIIQYSCSLMPLFFLYYVPTKRHIESIQNE